MLCLGAFELYSRWVPLATLLSSRHQRKESKLIYRRFHQDMVLKYRN